MNEDAQIRNVSNPGAEHSASDLLPQVYDQLRAVAQQAIAAERPGHTLQATALVHEAYLRLVGPGGKMPWSGRAEFFKAAAEAMRRILIEHARARGRVKRGGDEAGRPAKRLPISAIDLAFAPDEQELLAFDDELCRLECEDAQAAAVVRLRVFAGLTVEETADVLGISPRTVDRDWAFGRAWLFDALKRSEE